MLVHWSSFHILLHLYHHWHRVDWIYQLPSQPRGTLACWSTVSILLISPHWLGVDAVPPDGELMCPPTQIGDQSGPIVQWTLEQCTIQFKEVLLLNSDPVQSLCRVSCAPVAAADIACSFISRLTNGDSFVQNSVQSTCVWSNATSTEQKWQVWGEMSFLIFRHRWEICYCRW